MRTKISVVTKFSTNKALYQSIMTTTHNHHDLLHLHYEKPLQLQDFTFKVERLEESLFVVVGRDSTKDDCIIREKTSLSLTTFLLDKFGIEPPQTLNHDKKFNSSL